MQRRPEAKDGFRVNTTVMVEGVGTFINMVARPFSVGYPEQIVGICPA
jgi:hypothetical protein